MSGRGCNPFLSLFGPYYTGSRPDLDHILVLVNQYMRRYGEPPEVVYIPPRLMASFEHLYTEYEPYPHIEYVYRGMSIGIGDCERLYCLTPNGKRMYE